MNDMSSKKVMLSAVTPSNELTLGNYLGALKNWVKMHRDYQCLFFSVDLHALTTRQDPALLKERTLRALANYLAAGIDPKHALLFIQSHVKQHAELSWLLTCFSYMGELGRMTQYKDKSAKQGQNISAGLFTYPILMAADILLYQTDLVPVGEDQKQHVELTRDLAIRVNNLYSKNLFKVPEPYIAPQGARIMSLQNPTAKMSKSDSDPHASIYLSDSNDQILKKFKKAVTDSGTEITWSDDKPGIKNLLTIQSVITGKPVQTLVDSYRGKMYGHLKIETAEIVIQEIGPIRDKTNEILNDPSGLMSILKAGAEKAAEKAQSTLDQVGDAMGLIRG
jgi:tryptophanyl-tRNA synthetase